MSLKEKYNYKLLFSILDALFEGKTYREIRISHKCSFSTISKAKLFKFNGYNYEYKESKKPDKYSPEIKYVDSVKKNFICLQYLAQEVGVKKYKSMSKRELKKSLCDHINKF